ncbi:MAG TPA: AAA family ATPase [Cytophagales bacterium]|nr:AAA family ATPase [Cytophagales bacterium]
MDNSKIEQLRQALLFSPNNVPLKLLLAQSLVDALNYEEAMTLYKEVLQIDPKNQEATYNLALMYFNKQQYSTALVILEETIDLYNSPINHLVLFSKLCVREKDFAKALEYYKAVLEKNPHFKDEELDKELRKINIGQESTQENFNELFDAQVDRPKVNFDDVGGMNSVKEEIRLKIIYPLQNPDLYKAYGKKIGGGILLYGPPGCGKTHLARATAGEIQASFISVGIHDILDMFIGQSEKNLHGLFESARNNSPSVLFFDEVDALGASRSDMKTSGGRHLINQFLSEMDGINTSNDGLLILAATNAPWHLDSAFRRPGRFDRIVFVPPPDEESREAILKVLLKEKPVQDIDYKALAKASKDFSGADLKAMVDVAIEDKLTESMKSGKIQPVITKDLLNATKKIKPSTKEWFTTAKNYALYANESGLYDDILNYLNIKK